jgi:hypothetical protein
MLRAIAEVTGVSIDWLLGFEDVPFLRKERAKVGSFTKEIEPTLLAARPNEVEDFPVAVPADPEVLLGQLVEAWWKEALNRTAAAVATKLDLLAARIEEDAPLLWDLTPLLLLRARQIRAHSATLRSAYVRWRDLGGFEYPAVLIADNAFPKQLRQAGVIPNNAPIGRWFATPGEVWGGGANAGVAWRGATMDYVWFVDKTTMEVVHVRQPNYLYTPKGMGAASFFVEGGIKS